MKIYKNVEELIGGTPLMELGNLEQLLGLDCRLLAKLECFNPAGSAKDRIGAAMLADAEARGLITPGATIIEPTSGNTGVALAALAASKGYRAILTMPETMSIERQRLLAAYGAEIVLTPGDQGMKGAIDKALSLAAAIPNSFIPGQFENPANPAAHQASTGPEIWEDTGGAVDVFVAGVGSGGTLTGVGRCLKARKPSVKIVAVEPGESPLLSCGQAGSHGIQGIGANFVPENLDREIYDEVITVGDQEAYACGRLLAEKEGLLVGISSGAALWAAVAIAKRPESKGLTIVALLPDTGERYLSTPMFKKE